MILLAPSKKMVLTEYSDKARIPKGYSCNRGRQVDQLRPSSRGNGYADFDHLHVLTSTIYWRREHVQDVAQNYRMLATTCHVQVDLHCCAKKSSAQAKRDNQQAAQHRFVLQTPTRQLLVSMAPISPEKYEHNQQEGSPSDPTD